ncbi:uncharacterized protein NPIL_262861 [Nephila pilipes]|uniref:Uncharacterized protein n=1 Tax=Nephila pilipes TaxID=299642 RepID=A0A8X6TUM5_NEPPI|nr:uncharacterized protein NPIL_262861 [Nephila pilipes]
MTRSPLITIINNGQALTRPRWDHTPSPDRASRPDIRPPSFSSASRIEGSLRMQGLTTNQKHYTSKDGQERPPGLDHQLHKHRRKGYSVRDLVIKVGQAIGQEQGAERNSQSAVEQSLVEVAVNGF